MPDPVEFAKLSGSGNDFICIDNRSGRFDDIAGSPQRVAQFAKVLCHRGAGIGADGVIFAGEPEIEGVSDIAARFFEADGSEAELCGNGTGCFVHWITAEGWFTPREIKILTPAGVIRGQNSINGYVRVCIPDPADIRMDLEVQAGDRIWQCDYTKVGVPHLVVQVDDIEQVDVDRWGLALRHHETFGPGGVNVNFAEVIVSGEIAIRTFEFGVEGETLACGTGSAAAAILTARRFGWPKEYDCQDNPVRVHTRGGDVLHICFAYRDDGTVSDVCLETVVRFMYRGTLHPDLLARAIDQQTQTSAGR